MITLKETKEIADNCLEDISECTEMIDAYIFINLRTRCSIGGQDSPVVVMKEDGQVVPSTVYYSGTDSGEAVRTIRYVDYIEPASYFTPKMLKVAEEWDKAHSASNKDH